jgi:hypothetical protein
MSQSDRLMDLLASRVTEGLSETEQRELERLLADHDQMELDHLDQAAAAADLAFSAHDQLEPMPAGLKQRILLDADRHLPAPTRAGTFSARYMGWYAAAAMLILALWAPWIGDSQPDTPLPSLAQQRETLLAAGSDVIRVDWNPPEIEDYAGVRGDVVWSPSQQTGFMRLSGLPANAPDQAQYQLWIVDPTRDEHPIDGGVFDIVASDGEIIVPIDAKLEVSQAAAFAITLEKPGGVVVSDGPLLVVAPVT